MATVVAGWADVWVDRRVFAVGPTDHGLGRLGWISAGCQGGIGGVLAASFFKGANADFKMVVYFHADPAGAHVIRPDGRLLQLAAEKDFQRPVGSVCVYPVGMITGLAEAAQLVPEAGTGLRLSAVSGALRDGPAEFVQEPLG